MKTQKNKLEHRALLAPAVVVPELLEAPFRLEPGSIVRVDPARVPSPFGTFVTEHRVHWHDNKRNIDVAGFIRGTFAEWSIVDGPTWLVRSKKTDDLTAWDRWRSRMAHARAAKGRDIRLEKWLARCVKLSTVDEATVTAVGAEFGLVSKKRSLPLNERVAQVLHAIRVYTPTLTTAKAATPEPPVIEEGSMPARKAAKRERVTKKRAQQRAAQEATVSPVTQPDAVSSDATVRATKRTTKRATKAKHTSERARAKKHKRRVKGQGKREKRAPQPKIEGPGKGHFERHAIVPYDGAAIGIGSHLFDDFVIKRLVEKPFRAGTYRETEWKRIRPGTTVGQYVMKGGNRRTITWHIKCKRVRLLKPRGMPIPE